MKDIDTKILKIKFLKTIYKILSFKYRKLHEQNAIIIIYISKKWKNKILFLNKNFKRVQYRKWKNLFACCATVVITRNITMKLGKTSSEFRFIVFYWEIEAYRRIAVAAISKSSGDERCRRKVPSQKAAKINSNDQDSIFYKDAQFLDLSSVSF